MTNDPSSSASAGGARPGATSALLPMGTRLQEFELTGLVGEGGFGIVYEALDTSLQRRVAIKEYMPSQLASRAGGRTVKVRSPDHQATFDAGLKSFINEARMLAQFKHPALVEVFRFWEENGTAYMAMPYYEGETLKQYLTARPEMSNERWLRAILGPVLDALEHMHAQQCFHRDIAPDNILVLKTGNPILLDLGAARRVIGDMTQALTVILKPGYAPIEQYADDPSVRQGPWTDVYALAAVAYFAIMGKAPTPAVSRMMRDPLKPLTEAAANSGFSRQFLSAIDRALAVRPEDRPQSVEAFRAELGITTYTVAGSIVGDPDRTAQRREPVAPKPAAAPGAPGNTTAPMAPPAAPSAPATSATTSAPTTASTSAAPASPAAAPPAAPAPESRADAPGPGVARAPSTPAPGASPTSTPTSTPAVQPTAPPTAPLASPPASAPATRPAGAR
ncbi:MAG TPA: serine/threonine-protein kinase, partial [Quisquiliibacterium sp.]|nr:serine/threonine-protein kinase [Quisquiliibacterium sp.]